MGRWGGGRDEERYVYEAMAKWCVGRGGRSINKKCCSQHWHLPFPAHINAGGLSAIKKSREKAEL
jgi:hypothetical protein